MHFPPVNYLAVLVAAILMFILGGLWYSPVLFMKKWLALQDRTEEQMKAQAAAANMPLMYASAFVTAPTSYATAIFSGKPKQLWFIHTSYNLVSFVIAGAILGAWR